MQPARLSSKDVEVPIGQRCLSKFIIPSVEKFVTTGKHVYMWGGMVAICMLAWLLFGFLAGLSTAAEH